MFSKIKIFTIPLALFFNILLASHLVFAACKADKDITCDFEVKDTLVESFFLSHKIPAPTITKIEHQELYAIDPYMSDLLGKDFPYMTVIENQYLLDIDIGVLTSAQYNALQGYFKAFRIEKFENGKSYKLRDFLPLAAKSLINKMFQNIEYPIDFNYYDYLENDKKKTATILYHFLINFLTKLPR